MSFYIQLVFLQYVVLQLRLLQLVFRHRNVVPRYYSGKFRLGNFSPKKWVGNRRVRHALFVWSFVGLAKVSHVPTFKRGECCDHLCIKPNFSVFPANMAIFLKSNEIISCSHKLPISFATMFPKWKLWYQVMTIHTGPKGKTIMLGKNPTVVIGPCMCANPGDLIICMYIIFIFTHNLCRQKPRPKLLEHDAK
jgi:hypothetical protein